ncbi:Hypothetical predicted protein [Paramuricea clavata]|uniref:Uncharacterized protein n=1 Tax=Paramuricea clavata TaxID=317549 RepID=A0A7D9E6W6_PARCT|nr:Hypothetical predicted protein [Paramuricea clavata]
MKRKRAEALLQGRKHIKLEIKLLKSIKSENTSPPCSKNFREEQSDCFSVGIDLTESKRMENSKTFEKTSEQDLKNEDEELSEYEKRRLINIKRNQAMLISLGVTTAASFLSAKERRVPRKPKAKPFQPIRRSTRISGNANGRTVSQIVPNTPANSVAVTEKRQSGPVNAVPENDVEEADSKNFLHSLDMLNKNTKITTNIVSEEMSCTESFKERTSKLRVSVENVCKIVWEKITTMTFHPSCDKTIICAGDRKGNIGFWNVVSKETLRFLLAIPYKYYMIIITTKMQQILTRLL